MRATAFAEEYRTIVSYLNVRFARTDRDGITDPVLQAFEKILKHIFCFVRNLHFFVLKFFCCTT